MDKIEKNINLLRAKLAHEFNNDKTGHSADHLERTVAYALKICEKEGGNKNVVAISAYVHDVHRLIAAKRGSFCTPEESLPTVKEILQGLDITKEEEEHVLYAVLHHEEYAFGKEKVTVTDLESKILQDADNLDATGAIAIVRAFRYGLANKMPDYDPQVPFYQNDYTESVNDKSTVHHLYNKSLRIGDYMHTETARQIAKEKMALIRDFIDLYVKEFNCDF